MSAAKDAALALSPAERLELIEALWESLRDGQGDDLPVDDATKRELDRRMAAHASDGSTLSWDELKKRALD